MRPGSAAPLAAAPAARRRVAARRGGVGARPAAVAARPAAAGQAGRWVALPVVPAAATATAAATAAAAPSDATPTAAAVSGRVAPRRHANVAAGTPLSPTPCRALPPPIPLRRRLVVGRRRVALAPRGRRRPAAVVVRPLVLVCRPPPVHVPRWVCPPRWRLIVLLRLRLRLRLRLLMEVRGPFPPVVGPIVAPITPPRRVAAVHARCLGTG